MHRATAQIITGKTRKKGEKKEGKPQSFFKLSFGNGQETQSFILRDTVIVVQKSFLPRICVWVWMLGESQWLH